RCRTGKSEAQRNAPRRLLLLLRRLANRPLAGRSRLLYALLRRLLLHRHNGTPKVCGPARRRDAPPRNLHYAYKINKCLLRTENSSVAIGFGGGVGAIAKEAPATGASGLQPYDRLIMSARLGSPATARGGVVALGWRA